MIKVKSAFTMLSVLSMAFGSAVIYANRSASIDDSMFKLSIPHLKPGFEFNVAALWLKPGASNLNYVIYNKALPAQSPTWNEKEVYPTYTSAFDLGIRYIFPNTAGNDFKLDWTHLSSNNSASIAADGVSYFLGPDFEIGPAGIPIRNATGNAKFKYDVVNLDVGQFISFGQHIDMRFFGGLSTGFLREETLSTYTGNTVGTYPGPFSTMENITSNFTGVGPRAGLHADYNMSSGFGFLGEAAVSALIGSLYSKTQFTSSAQQLLTQYGQSVNNQAIEDQRVYQVIPGLDAKLGVSYKHFFKNNSLITISAGYQAAVYVNAISQYQPSTLVAGQPLETGGIFVATMAHTLSNYSVQGPFLNFAVQC